METIQVKGNHFMVGGKIKGNNDDKFNRAAKLAHKFDEIELKLKAAIEKHTAHSDVGKHAIGLLVMMHTGIRVGNEDSAEGYITNPHPNQKDKQPEFVQTYGLTTLKHEHFSSIEGGLAIQFSGKKCVDNTFNISDYFICRQLKQLLSTSTPTVFEITDSSLTKFIKHNIGEQFSPKDFRCMRANLFAWQHVKTLPKPSTKKDLKTNISSLFTYVSTMLNNTKTVCKKSYVSPEIVQFMNSTLATK